jgi:hypothetical protein
MCSRPLLPNPDVAIDLRGYSPPSCAMISIIADLILGHDRPEKKHFSKLDSAHQHLAGAAMSRKLEFEKEQARQRILKRGSETSHEGKLTQREKDALAEGREKIRRLAQERSKASRKALLNNFPTPTREQAERQLKALRGILAEMTEGDRAAKGDWIKQQMLRLEKQLAVGKAAKPLWRKK